MDAWFARACARGRRVRFGSAREMADAFHAAVTTAGAGQARWSPTTATPTPTAAAHTLGTTTAPTSQRLPAGVPGPAGRLAVVAGATAIVIAIGGGVAWHFRVAAPAAASSAPPAPTTPATATPAAIDAAVASAAPSATTPPAPSAPPTLSATVASVVKTTHPAVPAHATQKPPPPPSKPVANCSPPYYFDSAGNKVFKKECLGP